MKKLYVPHGEVVTYNCLYTDRIVVKGVLRVSGKLVAKEILGGGVVEAREIICDDIRADHVVSDFITTKRIAVNKLFVQFQCRASESIVAKDYFTAGYVNTGKLSVTLSDIQACDADEIITLKQKKSMLGLLWASWWRSLFLALFYGGESKSQQDDKKSVEAPDAENSAPVLVNEEPVVPENLLSADAVNSDMLNDILNTLQRHGYRVSKSEPQIFGREENAA